MSLFFWQKENPREKKKQIEKTFGKKRFRWLKKLRIFINAEGVSYFIRRKSLLKNVRNGAVCIIPAA